MEETEEAEPTWEERAQAVLAQLTITTPEGVINDQPLPVGSDNRRPLRP